MSGKMNSKERVLTTIARQEPDRVPVNYYGNEDIDRRLREHFGSDDLLEALGVDFRGVGPGYSGPRLHEDKGDVKVDNWGVHLRRVEHGTGGYWEYCEWPLANASFDEIEAWPMPTADMHDYSAVESACDQARD